jgi:phage gp29-like protein
MNGAISKIVVGQTMTTDDGSSRSQAQVHWEVRQDLVRADADLVCSSFNRGPATWLTEWNFPGAAIPKVWRRIEDEPDLKPQAERDKLVFEMGYRPTLKHITETYGGEWEPIASPSAPSPEPGPPAAAPPTFAEPRADTASRYAEQLDREAMGAMDGLIAPIRELVEQAGSLEELSDRLLEAYGQMPVDQLGALMQQTLTAAELAGRFEAQTGA